ncbi:MAG: hypothetical protein RR014_00955, partial [Bilophila sp.]
MSTHFEGLGKAWLTLFDDPERQIPETVAFTLDKGGTRECWQRKDDKQETMVIAWPEKTGIRVGVTVSGVAGAQLRPVTTFPFLEGLPNDMTIDQIYVWKSGTEGSVSALRNEDANPLWFYSPFLFRDREALTPGVRQCFMLAGLAYGIRKALLDEMTITDGPDYETHARSWLAAHPGSTRLEVPQIKLPLAGSRILVPDQFVNDYQMRVPIRSVDEVMIGPQKVYVLIVEFGLNTPNPLCFPLYVTERTCKGYVPHADDEIDA